MASLSIWHWFIVIAVGYVLYSFRKKIAPIFENFSTALNLSPPTTTSPNTPAAVESSSYTAAPPPPVYPQPSRLDTNGAVEDMRLARSYIDDWYEKPADSSVLSFAASYIEKARQKDPDAKLVIPSKNKDEDPDFYSQNELAGEVLYLEALVGYEPTAPRDSLIRTAQTLKRAIAFSPYSIVYRSKLADVYLNLYDRQSALAVAHEALSANPTILDARKLVDRIEAAPDLTPPTFFERNPDALPPIGILMIAGGVVLFVYGAFHPLNPLLVA